MVDAGIEWDIDANLPMYTRDYLKMQDLERKDKPKVILAASTAAAVNFCREKGLTPAHVIVVRDTRDLEGRRFRYEDVVRVQGWSTRPDIEEIEERILRTHIICSPR